VGFRAGGLASSLCPFRSPCLQVGALHFLAHQGLVGLAQFAGGLADFLGGFPGRQDCFVSGSRSADFAQQLVVEHSAAYRHFDLHLDVFFAKQFTFVLEVAPLQRAVATRRAVIVVDRLDDAVRRRGARIDDGFVEDDSPVGFGFPVGDLLDACLVDFDAPAGLVGNQLPACASRCRHDGQQRNGQKPVV